MHKNKYILIATLLITMFINVSTIDAKEIEYTCTYTRESYKITGGTSDIADNDTATIEIYSETEKNSEATLIRNFDTKHQYINNWIEDYEFECKGNLYTICPLEKSKENYNAWFKNKNYSTPTCPKYITTNNRIKSGWIASDSKTVINKINEELKDTKDISLTPYSYVVYSNPTMKSKNVDDSQATSNSTINSSDFNEKNYDNICQYTLANSENTTLQLYISSSSTYIKDLNPIQSSLVDNSGEIASNVEPKYGKKTETIAGIKNTNEITITNSIKSATNCPSRVYRSAYSNSEQQGQDNAITEINNVTIVEYYDPATATPAHNGTIVKYFLKHKRDAETKEEVELNEMELPESFGEDINMDSDACEKIVNEELQKTINKVLKYIRILVPILIIVLGLMDFGKAILSSKEEEMKKAQSTFIKRLIIGVAIFLLPTLINLIIDLANMAWKNGLFGNSSCGIK